MTRTGRRSSPLLLALVVLAACVLPGCGSPKGGAAAVTVLGPWTGAEQGGFLAMIRGFEKRYGIQVDYTGTRDADAVLASDLKNGNPPDLAVLATRGELSQFAAAGSLRPIDGALDPKTMATQYGPGWLRLMQAAGPSGNRHYYAILVKVTLKSVIWYDPAQFPPRDLDLLTSPGLTWGKLMSLTKSLMAGGRSPWCMGMADGSRSGWPGTDWIEDIVLHQSGPAVYDRWVAGTLPWTSAPIMRAWRTFGQVAATPGAVPGGTESELATSYGLAGQPMFTSPPRCYLDHEGSFVTGFYAHDTLSGSGRGAHPRPGADFGFISFPPLTSAGQGVEEVSGDLLAMFHDTPTARKLIAYLTTPQAQQAWISRPGSGALSADQQVPLSAYPDLVSRALARNLTHAASIHFDASNSMPQIMASAFNNAVLQYLDSPAQLNVILHGLEQVRRATYQQAAGQPTAGQPTAGQPTAGQLSEGQLTAGDCLTGSNLSLGISSSPWPDTVAAVPCTQPHIAEVFFAGNVWPQSAAYPGDKAIIDQGQARCDSAFQAYDGIAPSNSKYAYDYVAPSGADDWASGDRLVVCVAYLADPASPGGGSPIKYSIKGSGR